MQYGWWIENSQGCSADAVHGGGAWDQVYLGSHSVPRNQMGTPAFGSLPVRADEPLARLLVGPLAELVLALVAWQPKIFKTSSYWEFWLPPLVSALVATAAAVPRHAQLRLPELS